MTAYDGLPGIESLTAVSLWPSGLGWLTWVIIYLVAYMVNVFLSARMLLPTGQPNTSKRQRISNSFVLTLILSWPLVFLIVIMVSEQGGKSNAMGLAGSLIGWVFFVVVDFIANWKLFETYYPMRQRLGGSDAYANLHRHLWGHLLALVGVVITLMGVLLWTVMR